MPILNWIGKEAVVNHDKEVPFRLLKKVKSASVGENSQNLIIHGDNLEGLKAIMPYYVGKIKCIYIDPPYNTGNEKWVYNDKVNSPKIKKWLGKVVGGEAEDLCRHDKWLCMMYPRLKLLSDLLSEDGVIFVSIDDKELSNLKYLLDEIFSEKNVDVMIWKKSGEGRYGKMKNVTTFRKDHEYVLVAFKNVQRFNKIKEIPSFKNVYGNPDKDPRGEYKAGSISKKESASNEKSPNFYTVVSPSGKRFTRQFEITKEEFERLNKDILINPDGKKVSRIYWGKNQDSVPSIKIFVNEIREITPYSVLSTKGSTYDGKRELKEIFDIDENMEELFPNPKPSLLVKTLVQLASDKDSIVLDSFAGSGTTGHAVLDLNKEDGGNRKFILIEMEDEIAKNITAERVKRAIKKYDYKDGFEYCELDKPLFNKDGQIDEECSFEQLATYIYFTETQTNIDKKQISKNFIGEYGDSKYYLIFKERGKNVLDKEFLKNISKSQNKKVIYADKCFIDNETLKKLNIEFKQIPYEVKVY